MNLSGKVAVAAALLGLVSLTAPPPASALTQLATASLTATTSVAQTCLVDTANSSLLTFPAYDPIVTNKTAADIKTATVAAYCTLGFTITIVVPATLTLTGGIAGNTLPVTLSCISVGGTSQASLGSASSNRFTIQGSIVGGLNPKADSFTDTSNTQVTFNF